MHIFGLLPAARFFTKADTEPKIANEILHRPGVIAPTLVLVPYTKYRPASARNAGRTRHFASASLHFTPASVLASSARTSTSVPLRSVGRKLSRPAMTALRPSDSGIQRARCAAYRAAWQVDDHGDMAFTVPLFNEFTLRAIPNL